jgi:DNA topoisomerase VI subunit B
MYRNCQVSGWKKERAMKKTLVVFFCFVVMIFPGQASLAEEESKESNKESQEVNKEIKEASKEVAKESKNIFQKTGRAGKSFWQGMKEGFKETK